MIQTNESRRLDLRLRLSRPHSLRLFSSPHNASGMTTLDVLKELSGGGYKPQQLVPNRWVFKDFKATYPATSFSFTTSAGFVYGVFVLDDEAKVVRYAHTFDQPFYVRQNGDVLNVESFVVEA